MIKTTGRNIIHGMILMLGLAMIGVLVASLIVFSAWLWTDGIYFWVFYINKSFGNFQLALFVLMSGTYFFGSLLKWLGIELRVLEKAPSYLMLIALVACIIVAGASESGDIFFHHFK